MKTVIIAFLLPVVVFVGGFYLYDIGYDAGIRHTLRNIAYERNRGKTMREVINIIRVDDAPYAVND